MRDTTETEALATCINTVQAIADPDGVLVLPEHGTLIVSDLHFEKGSSYGMRGQMLPPYDTRTTLRRLAAAIRRHAPDTVIALGDSFHDTLADRRMDGADAEQLAGLVAAVSRWVWIEGNHDPAPPPQFGGEVLHTLTLGELVLRHEPTEGAAVGEVAGHLHPCAKVRGKGRAVRARCFATDGTRLIMPAFGAYTGGLNICDPAFERCFGQVPDALVMGRSRVYPVGASSCVPDRR
ncbi:ligase-associated DNA damage response endonuclease PdeM [Maricaulis sp.]|uniref:ligase-associated DNA damage response endonuclease PdeM n=1 Tax=Maricaulis sp. TaxID=1486257 RepID=UPI000C4EF7C9|nr:ligase-associated DNA damage response endonuclease PdeM [Maricaulis sp.]MAC88298.1 phosphoesterase [Maricaulis sp.]